MKLKAKFIASLKIWVAIYPSITMLLFSFGDSLSVFPLYIRTLILTLTLVPFIVFAGVPFVDLIIKKFSSKNEKKLKG